MTNLITSFIDMIIDLCNMVIPSFDFDSSTYTLIGGSILTVTKFLTQVNFIVPLGDIVQIIVLTLGLKLFKFTLFAGNWLVRRVCDLIP